MIKSNGGLIWFYQNYREESDSLLDQIEKGTYRLRLSNNTIDNLDSNDTVFDEHGDIIKIYHSRISEGSQIRIFPQDHFADYLYQVAVESDNEVFKKVEEDSKSWISLLVKLKEVYKDGLYVRLKENGLQVKVETVDAYFDGQRKFPMYKSDLKAMFCLKYIHMSQSEIDSILAPIWKSKSIYNNTMIALGRGLRQEIKLFLKEKRVGEILTKLQFNSSTMQNFIDTHMPLLTIKEKQLCDTENKSADLIKILVQTEL